MSDASVVFLPWVRQGLAARIAAPDPLTTPLPADTPLGVTLAVNGADAASMTVRLFGPADVTGVDPRQVVRTEPPAGTLEYESNDLVAVEFDNPDLPWLFTPAAADAQGRLRPWLVLVVVRRQDGVRLRPPRGEPLPVLEIAPPAAVSAELPDLADSWAWAHAQLAAHDGAGEAELRNVLATRPELSVGRLLCPRLLAPFTDYIACVVPAFEAGRLAGLGQLVQPGAALAPAWKSGAQAPANISLPVYFQWEFRTGAREDFESIVARLTPRDLSGAVGRRPLDIGRPGFAVPAAASTTVLLEGALQPIGAPRETWPAAATTPWREALRSIVNAANARSAPDDAEPVVGPPIYGAWYASRHEVGTAATPTWLDDLNLDPRERVAAALGTRVVQEEQEELMADAWDQAGEMERANQRLRQMQLSLAITTRLHARHVLAMNDDDALWQFASPAAARLFVPAAQAGAAPVSMRAMLAASSTPPVTISAPMRRLARPRGAVSRRAATALRVAGPRATTAAGGLTAAPAALLVATRVSTMFRLFGDEPQLMIFTLPPTRGLVTFDAVAQRLGLTAMTYARATNAAVAAAAQQRFFAVQGEPTFPPGGTLHVAGTVLEGAAVAPVARAAAPHGGPAPAAAARLRTVGDDGPEIPEDPEPVDPPPRPLPLPRGPDSADAKAFREAAIRHLARVNPQQPFVIFRPLVRAAFEPAAARAELRMLLDPAPVLMQRMSATIVVSGTGTPPAVGPIGVSPVFAQPMSEPLAGLSQDWLLPGLERVPPDTVALLEPNQRFIEAFMLGLNVEMSRELLWRDFPTDDSRASYFRRFWRAVSASSDGEIAPIAEWGERRLGNNAPGSGGVKQVVLLVRSLLFRRYPGAVVYAVPAVKSGNGRLPGPEADEIHPLFRGSLQPDVTFLGFELDPQEATGDPGWYFVIQQQPTEPRFGFDVEIDFAGATHVPLGAPPAGHTLPAGAQWARNSAHMAKITRQQPVRVAIHASELIGT